MCLIYRNSIPAANKCVKFVLTQKIIVATLETPVLKDDWFFTCQTGKVWFQSVVLAF